MSNSRLSGKLSSAQRELKDFRRDIDDGKEQRILGPESIDDETRSLLATAEGWDAKLEEVASLPPRQRSLLEWLGVLEAPVRSDAFYEKEIKKDRKRLSKTTDMRSAYPVICTVGFYKSFPRVQTVQTTAMHKHTDSDSEVAINKCEFYKSALLSKDVTYKLCDDLSRICLVFQGHLSHKRTVSANDQILVTEIASLLENSVSLIARLPQIPLCLSVITNRAVVTVDSFHLYVQKRANKQERDTVNIIENVSHWREAYEHFLDVESSLQKAETANRNGKTWVEAQIQEEIESWTVTVENPKSTASTQHQQCSGKIWNRKVTTSLFTFKFISEKFKTQLNLCILIENLPAESYKITQSSSGSFGTVYRVKLKECLNKSEEVVTTEGKIKKVNWTLDEVAVKVAMKESGVKENAICIRVAREIRIWSKMKHENIVPLLGLWSGFTSYVGPADYYVPIAPWMEEDLARYARKQVDKYHRLSLLRDVASALEYMHNRTPAVIHGDLRANNVLVKNGRAYLCDFGISKIDDNVDGFSTMPHGNVRWLPPERLSGDSMGKATVYGDMYSFGSVMFETLTGKCPWPNEVADFTVAEKRSKDRYATSPFPEEGIIDTSIQILIEKCWRLGPEFRPTSRFMRGEISNLMEKLPSLQCCV